MAENENVNKVVYGNQTLIDITDTTADDESVADGEVFYKASGARSTGTMQYVKTITFNGTTATCTADIYADNPTDRITATMILYNGTRQVDRWVASGTGELSFSFPATVESGVTYRLLVRYSINGVQQTAAETQKTCP